MPSSNQPLPVVTSPIPCRPGDVLSIDLDLLDANPYQPRTSMDLEKLKELAATIERSGLLQPIAVRPHGGRYRIVGGHRRVAAFRMLLAAATTDTERRRWALIKAHVVNAVSDGELAVSAYVENAQRADLTPLEEGNALATIRDLHGNASATEVAKQTGQPERRVRRLLKLAAAPEVVKDAVTTGVLVEVAGSGEEVRRERRKLDLIAALEFARFHQHLLNTKPATADDRTSSAMTRALTDNWSLRRIQNHVNATLNAQPSAEPITDTHPAVRATPVQGNRVGPGDTVPRDVCSSSSERLTLYLARLKDASRAQLEAARTAVNEVRELIDGQLQLLRDVERGPT